MLRLHFLVTFLFAIWRLNTGSKTRGGKESSIASWSRNLNSKTDRRGVEKSGKDGVFSINSGGTSVFAIKQHILGLLAGRKPSMLRAVEPKLRS